MTTLQKICLIALAAFWLASATWPDSEKDANAASGGSASVQKDTKAAIPPLP